MPTSKCLMTWDGKIIHQANGASRLSARDISLSPHADALTIDLENEVADIGDAFIYGSTAAPAFRSKLFGDEVVEFSYEPAMRAWHVQNEAGSFLCKEPYQDDLFFSRTQASEWEAFLFVDDKEISIVRHLLANRWVCKGGTTEEPAVIRFIAPFILQVGEIRFDLRLQNISKWDRYAFWVTHAGWRVERFLLFRPLVYITAYSNPSVLQQMRLCILSLRHFGRYDGPIIVMTDSSEQSIHELFATAGDDPGDLAILNLPAKDFVSFVCSKYSIDRHEFAGYQPLLYLDPDIVIDLPIETMLSRAARTDKLCAPIEEWNQLQNHVPVGASLLQMDGIETRFAPGLNGGTITIPNTEHAIAMETIGLIRQTIGCIGRVFGRGFNRWADQEAMNYVAVKTGAFDAVALTPYVVHNRPSFPQYDRRKGLVHFWGRSSEQKVAAMTEYVALLAQILSAGSADVAEAGQRILFVSSDAIRKDFLVFPEQKLEDRNIVELS